METPPIDPIRLARATTPREHPLRPNETSAPESSFESLLEQIRTRLQDIERSQGELAGPRSPRDVDGTFARAQTQYDDLMAVRSRLLEAYRLAGGEGSHPATGHGTRD